VCLCVFVKTKIDDLVDIYEFPKSLTKQQRAIVHVMAEASNLRHFSDGELDNKFITIQRIISNSHRSIISKSLNAACKPRIPFDDHVKIIVETVKSPKRRGQKPKSNLNSVVSQSSSENCESIPEIRQYNLRSRKEAK
jgi:hypothetical protein